MEAIPLSLKHLVTIWYGCQPMSEKYQDLFDCQKLFATYNWLNKLRKPKQCIT